MNDQQAQELTPAEREIVRGLKAWEYGCSDEETEGFYTGAKAALLAARPVQVERPDEALRKAVIEAMWRSLPYGDPDEAKAAASRIFDRAAARLPERPDEGSGREWKAEDGEPITRAFHDAYERLAPTFGYKTRESSAVDWEDVPAENKALMRATIATLLCEGVILPGPVPARPADEGKAAVESALTDPAQYCERVQHEYSALHDTESMLAWQTRAVLLALAARPTGENHAK
jgi:hypothetical protein